VKGGTHLVVPVKTLDRAKSRLVGAADSGAGEPAAHRSLVLAMVRDTIAAAAATPNVCRLLVVTSDRAVAAIVAEEGIEFVPDEPAAGLNAALDYGANRLLRDTPGARVGALQADLPALRPDDLASALDETGGRRAFCADRFGTGTTLLVADRGAPLKPRFGPDSAAAHLASGACPILAVVPTLRCDVDVAGDLAAAHVLGLGRHTGSLMSAPSRPSAGP